MVRQAAVWKSVTAPQAAQLFMDNVFRHHGLPEAFVSDRDPRFVSHCWQHLFRLLGTRLDMATADHPQTDDQTERVNRVLEVTVRSACDAEPTKWSTLLPQVEFALNNAVHSSTGFNPFYVNALRHPRTPLTFPPASSLGRGEANAEDPRGLKGLRTFVKRNLLSFIETGEAVRQRVRDAMAAAQDRQKENSDRHGRANTRVFQLGDQVLLNAKNLPIAAVSAVGSTKLRPRFIGPFTAIGVHGHAYTLVLPSAMATHPTSMLGCLSSTIQLQRSTPRVLLRRVLTKGIRHHYQQFLLRRSRGWGGSRNMIHLATRVMVLQRTDTRVERPDPAEMIGQGMPHIPDDPLVLRQPATHPIEFSTKVVHLLRQSLYALPQATQILGNFATSLSEGLDSLETPTQRHQVRPLGIQKSLAAFHGR
ncbi:unnamed protein product [Phytophthora fragariaefolia]|uniref:Unnamed protein product n=1 Tax=Phytophthora fragariaefolia TaxID=1490495 RepID=A0A9W6XSR8_9STRA|nr:unnamed protein product [Phytophthora fragariaefolia]